MGADSINEWVGNAKSAESKDISTKRTSKDGVKVVRNKEPQKSRGVMIMEIAEKLRPFLTKWFDGKYNNEGMLVQPAHIRGLALDMAEDLLKQHYNDHKASA